MIVNTRPNTRTSQAMMKSVHILLKNAMGPEPLTISARAAAYSPNGPASGGKHYVSITVVVTYCGILDF